MAKRPAARTVSVSSVGATKMRATISLSAPCGRCTMRGHRGHVVGREPVDDGAVALPAGEAQHALAQRGDQDRRRLLGHGTGPSRKPVDRERVVGLGDLLAGEGRPQEADDVADPLVGLVERDAVPALDDDVRRGADAEREPARRGLGQRADGLGEQRRAAGVGGHDGGAEPQRRRPHRGQRQRREGVGAVGLRPTTRRCSRGRPAPRSSPAGRAAGRRRTGWSCRSRGDGAISCSQFQGRTIADWLAVASSVPSSAHRWTWPWPKPRATASMRMSTSTHSVGTRSTTRRVLSRLLELMSLGMRLADAHRHEVAEHGERGSRDLEQVGHAGPHGGVAGAGGLDGHPLLD